MDTGGIVGLIVGVSLAISLIIVTMYAVRDDSLKTEAAKNKSNEKNKSDEAKDADNKEIIFDAEYDENCKKLIKKYGKSAFESVAVREYLFDLETTPLRDKSETYAEWCARPVIQGFIELLLEKQQEKNARIRYVTSLGLPAGLKERTINRIKELTY
jgi:hypothetical protein